jgi:Ca2+-binding EF-hand superfamily protein
MDLEYTITETIYRNHSGQTTKIDFQFDESTMIVAASTSTGISRNNKEKRQRSYEWSMTRDQYQSIISKLRRPIAFDAFVDSLRPIVMGHYKNDELERAFTILDRDQSGTINVKEFSAILPILNESMDASALREYIRKVDEDFDGELKYEEFRALVLRGIGRDIMCNHF